MKYKVRQLCVGTWIACGLTLATLAPAKTVLRQDSSIVIDFQGPFGDTQPWLEAYLRRYLLQALERPSLGGQGDAVTITVSADAVSWHELPAGSAPNACDAIEIDTRVPGEIRLRGATIVAAGFAIAQFLEDYIGVVWLFPGPLGVVVEARQQIVIPARHSRRRPLVASRIYTGIYARDLYGQPERYSGLAHRKRAYFWADDYVKSLRLRHLSFGSHNMINIFPIEECKAEHPEVFPIKDGKRHVPDPKRTHVGHGEHWHPCYSNRKTVTVAMAKAKEYFDNHSGQAFSLGINDGTRLQCACGPCLELGWPASYYAFVSKVANGVRETHPGRLIGVLSYGDVQSPPTDLKLPNNVMVLGTNLLDWEGKAKHLAAYEYLYGWGFWVPNFPLQGMAHNAKRYRDLGVTALHAEVSPLWAFDGPKVYLRSKLLWDPNYDVNAGLRYYCESAFGGAAGELEAFYRLWAELQPPVTDPQAIVGMTDFKAFRRSTYQFSQLSPTTLETARRLLAAAATRELTPKQRARIQMVNAFVEHLHTQHQMFALRTAVFKHADKPDYDSLAIKARDLQARSRRERAEMAAHPEWFFGGISLDVIEGLTWEGRYEWSLPYEFENAYRTALFYSKKAVDVEEAALAAELDGAVELKIDGEDVAEGFAIYQRPYNAKALTLKRIGLDYYHPDLHVQLQADDSVERVGIKTPSGCSLLVPAASPHRLHAPSGYRKLVYRGSVPLRQDRHYLFEIDLQARGGDVKIRVNNMNDVGRKLWLNQAVGGAFERVARRALLKPASTWGARDLRQVTVWEVEVALDPTITDASIHGWCSMKEIAFDVE